MSNVPSRPAVVLRLAKLVAMALADHDLTEHQFRMLDAVDRGDPDLSEMAVRLVMKPPNVTALVDGLVTAGLVERRRRTDDRRRVALDITPAGRRRLRAAERAADEALAGVAVLGPGEAEDRLTGLDAWAPSVEEAARLLRGGS